MFGLILHNLPLISLHPLDGLKHTVGSQTSTAGLPPEFLQIPVEGTLQMKHFRLALAAGLTAGIMYSTVNAAVQQEAAAAPALTPEPASPTTPEQLVPETPVSLQPEEVLHDRNHDIVLDAEGGFTGRLLSLSAGGDLGAGGLIVKVLQRGVTTGRVETDADGRFTVRGIEPGVGGILAFSERGLMLYGVRFVAPKPGEVPGQVDLQIDSAVVMGSDVSQARSLIMEALDDEEVRFVEEVVPEDEQFPYGTGAKATSLLSHRIQLHADGNLYGEVNVLDERTGRHREVLDMTVHFILDGRIVQSTPVENSGRFVTSGLGPGLYSVVGTGRDGVFAVGLQIVATGYDQDAAAGAAKPVSLNEPMEFIIAPMRATNINRLDVNVVMETETGPTPPGAVPGAMAPFGQAGPMGGPGGAMGGAAGGGGGGFGGGGGLGALIGAVAGGALGYLANNNNNDPPASPSN